MKQFKIPKMPKRIIKKVNKLNIILDNMAGLPDKVMLNNGSIWLSKQK